MRTKEEEAIRAIAPELTVHGVADIVMEMYTRTNADGQDYTVMNMGIVGKDGKLAHLTLFSRTGRIGITKLGDIDATE